MAKESAFKTRPKEENSDRCQSIYWNILYCIEAGAPGEVFFHELAHTCCCDHVHDLSHVRQSVENELSSPTLKAILDYSVEPVDIKKADIVASHYASWADKEVYRGLTFWNKAYYQTYYRWDKWASGLALFSASVGGIYKVYKRLAKK